MALAWAVPLFVEELAAVLERREAELRLEQAVHGLDVEPETSLQELLRAGLESRYDVTRERLYPSSDGPRSARPRCDLVLSRRGVEGNPDDEALWLEVRVAHQLRVGGGADPRYQTQWRRALVADLEKMRADPAIRWGMLALVVFTESEAILEKDLALFEAILAEAQLVAGFRSVRSLPIVDRIGHRLCSVAVWPLVQR